MNMNEKAVQAGFRRAAGSDTAGYVFLTELSDGRAGRRIYIKTDLAPKFAAMVEESRQSYVLHQLLQLRAVAGGHTSYTNQAKASQHKTQLGDIAVTYTITQQITGGLQPGVHITDIDFGLFGKGNLPGLYKVERRGEAWRVNATLDHDSVNTSNASINGLADNLEEAAQRVIPPMIEFAYGQNGLNQKQLHSEGFTHFYYPQTMKVGSTQWKTPEQKQSNHALCATKLARALTEAQGRGQKVQWTVHGSASDLLQSALRQIGGANLDKHEVMFMAPGALKDLLPMMQRSGMRLHKDVMAYSDAETSISKFKNTQWDAVRIANQIRQFGSQYKPRAELLETKAIKRRSSTVANTALTGLTLGAGTIGQAAMSMTNHGLRNTAASLGKVTDSRVNPHLNPHLCQDGFNLHAKTQAGGVGSAYGVTFKELVRKMRSA